MKIADRLDFDIAIDTINGQGSTVEVSRTVYCTDVDSSMDEDNCWSNSVTKIYWADTNKELTDEEQDGYNYQIYDNLRQAISDVYEDTRGYY